jgi:biotin carboxylase
MEKNIILHIGGLWKITVDAVRKYEKKEKRKFRLAVIYDSKKFKKAAVKGADLVLSCDFSSPNAITKVLLPYQEQLLAVTCKSETFTPYFQKIIPHVPYLRTPERMSLHWATDKIAMRNRFALYDKNITPKYTVVNNAKKESIKKVEDEVGYPIVVKPTGLDSSLLVSICFHKEELAKVLKTTFRKINSLHKKVNGRGEPNILVEQFMDGEMYSVDAYVNGRGKVIFCPFVHIKTGRSVGFDDFFGYRRITPVMLKKHKIEQGEKVSERAVHALGLRNTTVHIELMKTEDGWKVIEVGPRVGGFRPKMYELSFGINHTINDILIRIPERPVIPKKIKGYTAVMQFFAKKEGKLTKLTGIKKLEELKSFKDVKINKKLGDMCRFAKNGGKSVFNITLFNKNRSDLLADIRRLEQMIEIVTK